MADKPKGEAGDAAGFRLGAKLEPENSSRQDLATALAHERTLLRTMIDLIPAFIYAKDVGSRFIAMNAALARNMGTTADDAIGKTDFDFHKPELAKKFYSDEQALIKSGRSIIDLEEPGFDQVTGQPRTVVTSKVPLHDVNGDVIGIIGVGFDITDRKMAEQRLASGEKLESIGRLAAGVAHEINTPIQFLNDSIFFIREAMQDLMADNARLTALLPSPPEPDENIEDLKVELPPALDRVADGLARIAEIVRSMKEFSHADHAEMSRIDINRSIKSTLVIASTEYKYVADVETDFAADLPPVTCHGGQINQVVLNLVVNAAHAIGDVVKGTPDSGRITVRTRRGWRLRGDQRGRHRRWHSRCHPQAHLRSLLHHQGSGQGNRPGTFHRAQHDQVTWRHPVEFDTEIGKGTTFHVRLPVEAAESEADAA